MFVINYAAHAASVSAQVRHNMSAAQPWRTSPLRASLLEAANSESTESRKGAFMNIVRFFTVPENNQLAKDNLLELWQDDGFLNVLLRALAPDTPYLLLPSVMVLLIHLTFHEDIVETIWANQNVRAALLRAARLLDRTAAMGVAAVDEPGRASTRLEAFQALHNLTCVQDNLATLWQVRQQGPAPPPRQLHPPPRSSGRTRSCRQSWWRRRRRLTRMTESTRN
jgi:hypothetical protein